MSYGVYWIYTWMLGEEHDLEVKQFYEHNQYIFEFSKDGIIRYIERISAW